MRPEEVERARNALLKQARGRMIYDLDRWGDEYVLRLTLGNLDQVVVRGESTDVCLMQAKTICLSRVTKAMVDWSDAIVELRRLGGPIPLRPIMATRSRYAVLMCAADLWDEMMPPGQDPLLAGRLRRLATKMVEAGVLETRYPTGEKITLTPVTIADLDAAIALCRAEESFGWAWSMGDMRAEALGQDGAD